MKRYSLILCLVLIVFLSGVASAQILIDAGGPASLTLRIYGITYGSYFLTFVYPYVGLSSFTTTFTTTTFSNQFPGTAIFNSQAAFEFDLGAVNTTPFTSKNFTARLNGLNVTGSIGSGAMNVDLYDMGDGTEDGDVYYNDHNSKRCNRIARRTHDFTGTAADFSNIDVTCALRNDLFGAGAGNYSGFILKSPDATGIQFVRYDSAAPTLMINPGFTGPDCPDCGGGGSSGGCFIVTAARNGFARKGVARVPRPLYAYKLVGPDNNNSKGRVNLALPFFIVH